MVMDANTYFAKYPPINIYSLRQEQDDEKRKEEVKKLGAQMCSRERRRRGEATKLLKCAEL